MDLFRKTDSCNLGQACVAKTIRKSSKQRTGTLLFREKGGSWEPVLQMKVHWKKVRVQDSDGFQLSES